MVQLTDEQAQVIDIFLSEHWSLFESHCDEQGVDADEFTTTLGGN